MLRIAWRDLACLPWLCWITLAVTDFVLRMPPSATHGETAMPLLLSTLATGPAFLFVWVCRRVWFVREGWWIPLGLILLRSASSPDDADVAEPFAAADHTALADLAKLVLKYLLP